MRASESTNIMGAGTNELPEAKKAKSQLLLFLFVFVVSLIVFQVTRQKVQSIKFEPFVFSCLTNEVPMGSPCHVKRGCLSKRKKESV